MMPSCILYDARIYSYGNVDITPVHTIGQGDLLTEMRAANRGLQARVVALERALAEERAARVFAQQASKK